MLFIQPTDLVTLLESMKHTRQDCGAALAVCFYSLVICEMLEYCTTSQYIDLYGRGPRFSSTSVSHELGMKGAVLDRALLASYSYKYERIAPCHFSLNVRSRFQEKRW